MRQVLAYVVIGAIACLLVSGHVDGRGFGGFRGGYGGGYRSFGGYGGYRGGSWGGYRSDSWGGRSYSGYRSGGAYSGWGRAGGYGSYDRSWTGARGGSVDVSGTRGAAVGPRGAVAGGTRDVTATGPEGRTYSGSRTRGAAVGPYGRVVGGDEHYGTAVGPHGAVSGGWRSAYRGTPFATDFGIARNPYFSGGALAHSTSYWSHGYMTNRAGYVRTGFGYYNCFRPAWFTAHPGCWYAAGWAGGAAWATATWPA